MIHLRASVKSRSILPASVEPLIVTRQPFLWINDGRLPLSEAQRGMQLGMSDVLEAETRWNSFAPLLAKLFPELRPAGGIIESPLFDANALQRAMTSKRARRGRLLIKGDHALPVAGSIKARGGIYEVLVHAEELALTRGIIGPHDDREMLASSTARQLFAHHQILVGSTGNLGLSIGVIGAALGFQAIVHMSADAKAWKKERLRAHGVTVVEHEGDFAAAVAAGRDEASHASNAYFVDDEHSRRLFLGYSVAALRLHRQLAARDIKVDEHHPLFIYLPCGVGGAPGGITFGLRQVFGDFVHCFFAEPVASPCMLIRLASTADQPVSVEDVGLDNRTDADGLAVGRASELVAPLMKSLVSGVFTVPDEHLFQDLYALEQTEGLRIEPSAAAAFRGPRRLLDSEDGQRYLNKHRLAGALREATHVVWTTGGCFVPAEEYRRFHERGRTSVHEPIDAFHE